MYGRTWATQHAHSIGVPQSLMMCTIHSIVVFVSAVSQGTIVYELPRDFRSILQTRSLLLQLAPVGAAAQKLGAYLVSFLSHLHALANAYECATLLDKIYIPCYIPWLSYPLLNAPSCRLTLLAFLAAACGVRQCTDCIHLCSLAGHHGAQQWLP